VLVASGGVDTVALVAAMPTVAEVVDEPEMLPAYRAATDQAEQPLGHFDDEEPFDLAELYGNVGEVGGGEVEA
jgi:hypothetical protein